MNFNSSLESVGNMLAGGLMKLKRSRQIVLGAEIVLRIGIQPVMFIGTDRHDAYPTGSAGCAILADSAVDQSSTVSLYVVWSMGGLFGA